MSIVIGRDWYDPEASHLEIVERKGLGHPDTLADALADEVSRQYSEYCLSRFGVVLHHNVDKLYIGAGLFERDFGHSSMVKPVRVQINGRMSSTMNGEEIPLSELQTAAVRDYLGCILPHLDCSRELQVICNSTQHTRNPHWFTPRGIADLPEVSNLCANDTSVCVAHWPMTICEQVAFELERSLWTNGTRGTLTPRFADIGQDIKVMVVRYGRVLDITACVPTIASLTPSLNSYNERIREIEELMSQRTNNILSGTSFSHTVKINPTPSGEYGIYLLAVGSCIDCGEEGVVGRGNTNQGVISVFRPHTMEAPSGKNPVYHTGRVIGILTSTLARRVFEQLGVRCTVVAMTKNRHSLLPPSFLSVQGNVLPDRVEVERLVSEIFSPDSYLDTVLNPGMRR